MKRTGANMSGSCIRSMRIGESMIIRNGPRRTVLTRKKKNKIKICSYARWKYQRCYSVLLNSDIEIHHIDGDCLNDRLDNLSAVTADEHLEIHR